MKIIESSIEVLQCVDGGEMLKHIERCGRVAYKSEDKITEKSAEKFVAGIIERGHESVLEHASITVKFICDRGVSHELVRHRIASYTQESTRYVDYKTGLTVIGIDPSVSDTGGARDHWEWAMKCCECAYQMLIAAGHKPQIARAVLPTCLKTEIIMTANLREWRHFFRLRTAKDAHPDMRRVACMALDELRDRVPVVFDDIEVIT